MALPTSTTIYGKSPSQQSKVLSTSKVDKITGFKYPMEDNPRSGYFGKSVGRELRQNNLKTLLRTSRGERFMLPEYGCNLKKFLMEQLNDVTFSLIKQEVLESISRYLKSIDVHRIQVFQSESFPKTINVRLYCSFRDDKDIVFDVGIKI